MGGHSSDLGQMWCLLHSHLRLSSSRHRDAPGRAPAARLRDACGVMQHYCLPTTIIVHLTAPHVVRVSVKSGRGRGGAWGVSTGVAAGLKLPLAGRGERKNDSPRASRCPAETDLTPVGAVSQLV